MAASGGRTEAVSHALHSETRDDAASFLHNSVECSVGVMTCLVPTEGGILPNICNLCLSMQSGKPHPEASAWLHNYNNHAGGPAGTLVRGGRG